jgi:hypothetical protein
VKTTRLFVLVEAYLEGTLDAAGREELVAAVKDDAAVRAAFVEQVRLARRLRAIVRPPGDTWNKIAALLGPEGEERGRKLADRVEAVIDRERGRASARRVRRWLVAVSLPAAAAAALLLARSPARPPAVPPAPAEQPTEVTPPRSIAQAPSERQVPPGTTPPPRFEPSSDQRVPAPAASATGVRAAMVAEMEKAEPALARRPDVVAFLGFDGVFPPPLLLGRLRPRFTGLAPGVSGNGLRVIYGADEVGLKGGGARLFVSTAAQTVEEHPQPQDELYLRYYVRLDEGFDFAGGGLLPGLCVGVCVPARRARGEGGIIGPRWTPFGELAFEPLPGTRPRDRRWQKFLDRGGWHVVEMRVKLNAIDASDGVVEGWFDGERAASLTGLRLRDSDTTHIEGAAFETIARGRKAFGPARDTSATFDSVVIASKYIGPRQP